MSMKNSDYDICPPHKTEKSLTVTPHLTTKEQKLDIIMGPIWQYVSMTKNFNLKVGQRTHPSSE